jgi:eukaryotic-like serine/threonine-protein kinase
MALEFGRYQLLKKIASGGMGQVFLARQGGAHDFEKLLVIKRILPNLLEDEEFFTMFFDEARIAARLNHPNIVQIFDLGEVQGSHYLAMEYVPGEDVRRLEKFLRGKDQTIPVGAACRIVADAAAGLDYAHKARDAQGKPLGLVHRDVSPQNVLVGFDGGVKLIDFGVAKAAGKAQQTATGILKGKYAYMSPEQADGQEIDPRSDVFALGIVFWEILTGRRLFKGDNDVMTMRLVRDCSVPPPSKLKPALPPGLDAIVLKALQKDLKLRYQDAMAFRLAIEDFAVSHHVPASSAHLVAFLATHYADRIALEQDPASLDQLTPNTDLEGIASSPSHPTANPADRQAQKTPTHSKRAPAPEAAERPGTVALAPPPRSRKASGVTLLSVAAVVVIAAAVAIPRLVKSEPDDDETPDRVVVARTVDLTRPAPPVVDPPGSAQVALKLVSEPAGARVEIGGKEIGLTPLDYALEPEAQPMVAVFTKEGFEAQQAVFSSKDAPQLSVQLKKVKARGKKPTLGIKTGR